MENKNNFFNSVIDVGRLFMLIFCILIVVVMFLFSIKLDFKNYDIVLSSRLNSMTYYGVEYSPSLEVWKIERSKDGSMYTRRLFP